MLILARDCGEVVRIGAFIKLTVMGIQDGAVHLGIQAPDTLAITPKRSHRGKPGRSDRLARRKHRG